MQCRRSFRRAITVPWLSFLKRTYGAQRPPCPTGRSLDYFLHWRHWGSFSGTQKNPTIRKRTSGLSNASDKEGAQTPYVCFSFFLSRHHKAAELSSSGRRGEGGSLLPAPNNQSKEGLSFTPPHSIHVGLWARSAHNQVQPIEEHLMEFSACVDLSQSRCCAMEDGGVRELCVRQLEPPVRRPRSGSWLSTSVAAPATGEVGLPLRAPSRLPLAGAIINRRAAETAPGISGTGTSPVSGACSCYATWAPARVSRGMREMWARFSRLTCSFRVWFVSFPCALSMFGLPSPAVWPGSRQDLSLPSLGGYAVVWEAFSRIRS